MRRCVWSRNLKNEEVMVRVGPQRHRKKKNSEYIKNEIQELGKDNKFGLEGMEYGFTENEITRKLTGNI